MSKVLAVDPGRDKCGLAVVTPGHVILKQIVPRSEIIRVVAEMVSEHAPDEIIVGNGTGSSGLIEELRSLSIPLLAVEESYSTQRARTRYFLENPPRGFLRLIPRGLLSPPCPVDDYAAVVLAESHLRNHP